MDTLETLYAARSFDEKHMRDYLGRTDLTIRYGYFNTQYVFQPLKLWELQGGRGLDFSDLGGDLVWKKKRGYGTEYQIEYFQINLGQPEFLRFLEEMEKTGQPEPSRDILWEQALLEYERRTGEQTDWETMEAYRQYVYDTYLPEAVVSQEKLSTSSKAETLLAIEQELSEFTYTRTPGKMPETVKDAESVLVFQTIWKIGAALVFCFGVITTLLKYFLIKKPHPKEKNRAIVQGNGNTFLKRE